MASRRLEDERMNEDIPLQFDQVDQVSQDGKGVHGAEGAQVPFQGDHIPITQGKPYERVLITFTLWNDIGVEKKGNFIVLYLSPIDVSRLIPMVKTLLDMT